MAQVTDEAMGRTLKAEPLTAAAFAPYGDVIETAGDSFQINNGVCDRFHDRARIEVTGEGGRIGISLGSSRPYALPLSVALLERHPLGSQAFLPMSEDPFIVVVAPDEGGVPGRPRAFLTDGTQGVNYLRGAWHGILTPLGRTTRFVIVDRIGPGKNLEEHHLETDWVVVAT